MTKMKEELPQKQKSPKSKKSDQENSGLESYAKYSGLAFQMIGVILIPVWGGVKLDKLLGLETPVFTIVLSLLGVFASIYIAIKDFIK
jgi:F0F1-type ATP synthase assembly protein I